MEARLPHRRSISWIQQLQVNDKTEHKLLHNEHGRDARRQATPGGLVTRNSHNGGAERSEGCCRIPFKRLSCV